MPLHRRLMFGLFALFCLDAPPAQVRGGVPDEPEARTLVGQPIPDFKARRKELMKRLREGTTGRNGSAASGGRIVVVVRGQDLGRGEDFEEGRFFQARNFLYLTGVETPGCFLMLLPGDEKEVLYVPPGARGFDVLSGEPRKPDENQPTAERVGFEDVRPTSALLGDLFTAIADPYQARSGRFPRTVVYTLSPNPRANATSADARFVRFLSEGAPSTEFRDLASALAELRRRKTKAEIEILQRAIDITGDAQDRVARIIRPGLRESALEGQVSAAFLARGAMRPGFASIIGSGPNSTIPHYFLNSREMKDGDLVVVDIGAEYQYYTADITRTYPVNGTFTERQRSIYQLVLDCQSHVADRVKPGECNLLELTGWAREFLRNSPLRAKDERGEEHTMDHFFIHGLSHYLGMDVHDVGDISKPFQPGDVFTIEPGIYIRSENLGVRIEDDYLVTESGLVKMSRSIPSAPDEIERKIAGARARAEAGR